MWLGSGPGRSVQCAHAQTGQTESDEGRARTADAVVGHLEEHRLLEPLRVLDRQEGLLLRPQFPVVVVRVAGMFVSALSEKRMAPILSIIRSKGFGMEGGSHRACSGTSSAMASGSSSMKPSMPTACFIVALGKTTTMMMMSSSSLSYTHRYGLTCLARQPRQQCGRHSKINDPHPPARCARRRPRRGPPP